jgi:isopentenyl diphosphate isomerase/L-lactate dehydrogenase-like FMN-dependent dehydrogenase
MEQNIRAGDSNRITREYFESLLIEMRHIGAIIPDTRLHLYGEEFSTPVMTSAFSHLDRFREDGMVVMAEGAKAAGAVMWAGWGSDTELERITATGAKTIKIIKPKADNGLILHRIAHAEACGCIAVGMDVDHSFNKKGEYDNIRGTQMAGKTLDEIRQFAGATKLPFIIKGVLSVQDALKCLDAGVRGIVLSHHHGIMDYAVPPLMILPKIIEAVGDKIPVFVDCGVESGFDAFKALALGAAAVCVGRTILEPLKENGADGVKDMIQDMTAQLAGAMARTCSPDITRIDSSLIWKSR